MQSNDRSLSWNQRPTIACVECNILHRVHYKKSIAKNGAAAIPILENNRLICHSPSEEYCLFSSTSNTAIPFIAERQFFGGTIFIRRRDFDLVWDPPWHEAPLECNPRGFEDHRRIGKRICGETTVVITLFRPLIYQRFWFIYISMKLLSNLPLNLS